MKSFFSKEQEKEIVATIRKAELGNSGEIKVHLEKSSKLPALDRAKEVFRFLKMDKLKDQDGVLIYIDIQDRQFAIYGGKGIDEKTAEDFWSRLVENMEAKFRQKQFFEGMIVSIEMIGEELRENFPSDFEKDDNELSDDISKS